MNMKYHLTIATMTATLAICCHLSAQTSFDFQFNDNPGNPNTIPGTSPIVGTGTFTFATDPGDGTFPISDLGTFTMSFSFTDGDSFNQSDITSDLSEVLVVLSGSGATRRLQFSDNGSGGGGPWGGSLDLTSDGTPLSYEASSVGAGLNGYVEGNGDGYNLGDYLTTAASVPDGGFSFWLLGIGCFALVIAGARSPRKAGLLPR